MKVGTPVVHRANLSNALARLRGEGLVDEVHGVDLEVIDGGLVNVRFALRGSTVVALKAESVWAAPGDASIFHILMTQMPS